MTSATLEEVVFCVKPSQPSTAKCPSHGCQQCETLQYYFENMDATITWQENVTMIFMGGTHEIVVNDSNNYTLLIFNTFKMTGESQIQNCLLYTSDAADE